MDLAYLVSSDQRELGLERPVALAGVEVGVADTGALEADEALAGLEVFGLADGVVVDDVEGGGLILDDGRLLGLGDLELGGRHRGRRAEAGGGRKSKGGVMEKGGKGRGGIYSGVGSGRV